MNIDRFNGHANAYTRGRPDYAEKLIDCLYNEHGLSSSSVIADMGTEQTVSIYEYGRRIWEF